MKKRKQHIYLTCLKPTELSIEQKKMKGAKEQQQKIYGEFVAEQVAENRVYTIRYIQYFLNVSRDWIVKNIIPNVKHWKFYDRYIYPYHKHIDPDLKGGSHAKMHDLINVYHVENDNGKLLFSLDEVLNFLQENIKFTRQTILINLFKLMSKKQIEKMCSCEVPQDKKNEIIENVMLEYNLKIADSKSRSAIEHININNINITNLEHQDLKNRLFTAKEINVIPELAYRYAFTNGLIKITFKSDNKTWFFECDNEFKNDENFYKFTIAYDDYLNL